MDCSFKVIIKDTIILIERQVIPKKLIKNFDQCIQNIWFLRIWVHDKSVLCISP